MSSFVRACPLMLFVLFLATGCQKTKPEEETPADAIADSVQAVEEIDLYSEPLPEEERNAPVEETAISQPQRGRNFPERIENTILATKVRLALAEHPQLRAYEFAPDAQRGRVTLRGAVRTAAEKTKAEEVVSAISGVEAVINEVAINDTAGLKINIGLAQLAQAEPQRTAEPETEPVTEADPPTETPEPVAEEVEEAPARPATASGPQAYTIRSGDTFGAIAQRHNTTVAELQRLNPGVDARRIRPGQQVRVPSGGSMPAAAQEAPREQPASQGQGQQFHTVRSGDTLGKIASQYGTTVGQLQRLNPSLNPRRLQLGQRIRVK